MKRYINYIACAMLATSLSSCHDWLTEDTPGSTKLEEAFTSVDVAVETANAVYVPLMWEYSGTTYYPEWFVGDVVSDDALKGGQYVQDMAVVRDMENFKTTTNNEFLLCYYRAQWQGISRANLAIQEIPKTRVKEGEEATLDRLVGEAKFLRAYYYFRLCRMFGGMPLVDFVVDSSEKWHQERASQDDTYAFIIKDLEDAEAVLPLKNKYAAADLGRATKGAAQAMLLKANLYRAGFLAQNGQADAAQETYLGDSLCNRKYAMYTDGANGKCYHLTHDSRGPLNNKQIRYSDVLLMYAEACCETGDLATAAQYLNLVRQRVGLSAFPYTATIQGKSVTYSNTQEDLRKAIRHERRVELAMEGHRWFDLCRWGIAKETMDAYLAGETAEAKAESAPFEKGKHELFPIPSKEIDITGIAQNPNY